MSPLHQDAALLRSNDDVCALKQSIIAHTHCAPGLPSFLSASTRANTLEYVVVSLASSSLSSLPAEGSCVQYAPSQSRRGEPKGWADFGCSHEV